MQRSLKPLEIVVYQDVLCAWCYLADRRLEIVRREIGEAVRWTSRPYALRLKDAQPSPQEIHDWVEQVEQAKREPDGRELSKDLWLSADPPRSSVPALAALEAARLQGADAAAQLARYMQRAALQHGLNVARPDVTLELASSVGLDMNRFVTAWRSPQTRQLVLEEHRLASARGVKGVPTLVIGGRWMLSGLRATREYRRHILECVGKFERSDVDPGGPRILH
jgi:predicted DsbA family dithiol-disulfide isomerase